MTIALRILTRTIVIGAFLLILVEISCALFFNHFFGRFTFADPARFIVEGSKIAAGKRLYDAELGWDTSYRTEFGERPRSQHFGRPLISAFGDSFTFGAEVNDDETWEQRVGSQLHADVLNFGVSGFGPDQALLKFRRKFPNIKTPVVTFGIISENINRLFSVYRPFYFPLTDKTMSKPRFELRDGKLELIPNPLASITDLDRLAEPEFIEQLGELDYWYNRERLPILKFPYSFILFNRHLWLEAFYRRKGQGFDDIQPRPWENLWKDPQAQALLLEILSAFMTEARLAGATPVLLLLSQKEELMESVRGHQSYSSEVFTSFCFAHRYLCFDGIAALTKKISSADDVPGLYHNHMNAAGNSLLGDSIFQFFTDNGLIAETGK